MRPLRFSFILPAFKGRFLDESIKSILAQTYTNFELVIVNDASPDNIAEIVANNPDSRIRYYENEENIGGNDLVAQWNKCLSLATAEYTILATDDDLYEPNFLESFIPLIEKYPEVNVFKARILTINSFGNILSLDRYYKEWLSQAEITYNYLNGSVAGGIPQNIFRTEELRNQGGFVSFLFAWGSDDATTLALSNNGIVFSQEILVRFRWSDENISSNKSNKVLLQKIIARTNLCEWISNYIKGIKYSDSDIEQYFKNNFDHKLNIYLKIIIINEIKRIRITVFLKSLHFLIKRKLFSTRDILSICYQYLRSFI